ncbi:RNA-directed DNA polymerase, eukaryota, reverse transcriptase zinc-binding domain protein [Tanacetum coccineum]
MTKRWSVFQLPTTVIKDIETLFKGFLWCNGDPTKGKARVAWNEVCKPKYQEGLGLKPLDMWNNTLLIKHLWNIVANKESIWVKWINTVKLNRRSIWDTQCYGNDSWWNDNQTLSNHISKREVCLAGFNDQSKLCDIVYGNRWKWHDDWMVKHNFLLNIYVPTFNDEPDKVSWATNQGKMVKHTFILWLDIKEKLITQDKLLKWYPQKVACCPYCKANPDSHEHLFFQCNTIAEVWKTVKVKARIKSAATS